MGERLQERATWLVNLTHQRSHALLTASFAEAGSRPYHYRILAALEESGPVSQAELGRLAGIDRSDVTAALDILGRDGHAERRADPSDGRKNVVVLTRTGRRELERLDAVLDDVQRQFLAPLGPDEQRQFVAMMRRLAPPNDG